MKPKPGLFDVRWLLGAIVIAECEGVSFASSLILAPLRKDCSAPPYKSGTTWAGFQAGGP